MKLTLPSRRYHVALVDRLPAGLEPQNPSLATTGAMAHAAAARDPEAGYWWRQYWFRHQNLRDDRAEAFSGPILWEGDYVYRYLARATTTGVFMVPPAKAEEMYTPETFGRSRSDRVIVE
jgi:uncharacterized protein YfaS (alpha-2-macroglobulin family)